MQQQHTFARSSDDDDNEDDGDAGVGGDDADDENALTRARGIFGVPERRDRVTPAIEKQVRSVSNRPKTKRPARQYQEGFAMFELGSYPDDWQCASSQPGLRGGSSTFAAALGILGTSRRKGSDANEEKSGRCPKIKNRRSGV